MKKIVLALFVILVLSSTLSAKERGDKRLSYRGFSGGMMLHTGYVSSGDFTITGVAGSLPREVRAEGMPTGMGGAIRFSFGDHLRIGGEGYVSNLKYGEYDNSRISLGWGGLLVDMIFEGRKISPYIGMTLGGGRVRNLTIFQPTPLDFVNEEEISFRSYSVAIVTPYVGVEYPLTSKMRVVFKVDYVLSLSKLQPDFVHGPRVYLGFVFDRTK